MSNVGGRSAYSLMRDLFRFIYRKLPGGAYRDRTDDPLLAKQVLSQLS